MEAKKVMLMVLLLIPVVSAAGLSNDNYVMSAGIGSNTQLSNDNYKLDIVIGSPQAPLTNANYKVNVGYLTNWIVATVTGTTTKTGGGGGGSAAEYEYQKNGATLTTTNYVLSIDNLMSSYEKGSTITPVITLLNTGKKPDKNATLYYLITDTEGNEVIILYETYTFIPVACMNATYSKADNACRDGEGTLTPAKGVVLNGSITLTEAVTDGKWQYRVRYETTRPKLEAYKTFRVGPAQLGFTTLLIIVAVLALLWRQRKKKKT